MGYIPCSIMSPAVGIMRGNGDDDVDDDDDDGDGDGDHLA